MKGLNEKQKKIIIIGIIVIGLMSLFPPWTHTKKFRGGISIQGPVGYSFIFIPPKKINQVISYGFKLDVIRLFVQWLIVLMATGLGVFITSTKKIKECKTCHQHIPYNSIVCPECNNPNPFKKESFLLSQLIQQDQKLVRQKKDDKIKKHERNKKLNNHRLEAGGFKFAD